MKILVLGRNGQVASSFSFLSGSASTHQWTFVGRDELDLLTPAQIPVCLQKHQPDLIINATAYTAVDKAETERESARLVNTISPGEIANWCVKASKPVPLVHFSTDYVYPGSGVNSWSEEDPTSPQNHYGETKLQGENLILASGARAFIFRTSWVYHWTGTNFVRTMLRLAKEHGSLKIVGDQIGSPTAAVDLAMFVIEHLPMFQNEKTKSGVYNLCGQGTTSWAGFAEAIFQEAQMLDSQFQKPQITPIPSSEYPTPARRPLNSRMNLSKVRNEFGSVLPPWNESLKHCIGRIYGS